MPRVNLVLIESVLEMQENKENLKLVEVLKEQSYKEGHVQRAVNIPMGKLSLRLGILLK